MQIVKSNLVLAASIAATAALIVALVAGVWLEGRAWYVRGAPLCAVLAAGLGVTATLLSKSLRNQQAAQRYVRALCLPADPHASPTALAAQLPALPDEANWSELLSQFRDALAHERQRAENAEHSRAALEIRARRQAAQRERVNAILSNLSEPVLAIDDYDELVLANRSAERLFGFDAGQVERRAIAELVRCERLIEVLGETRRRRAASNRTEELQIPGPDGSPRWYSVTTSSMVCDESDQDGLPVHQGVVAVLRDIAAQKEAQKRNAEFVSAASHEMKTPLAAIKAYVEMLVDGDAEDEETREEFLEVINTQADRLQRMIENLLNLARIEAGVVKVHKEPHSLNELLETALHVVTPSAEGKQITLTADLSPLYLGALVDRDMLTQAAINLLSNAIKYTPEGGSVTLRSRMADDELLFEVEDNGVGLSPEDCDKVFEKFYRVKANSEMASGTGLGLPLVKHIIEDVHSGRLAVRSTLGAGSTFSVYLPSAGQQT